MLGWTISRIFMTISENGNASFCHCSFCCNTVIISCKTFFFTPNTIFHDTFCFYIFFLLIKFYCPDGEYTQQFSAVFLEPLITCDFSFGNSYSKSSSSTLKMGWIFFLIYCCWIWTWNSFVHQTPVLGYLNTRASTLSSGYIFRSRDYYSFCVLFFMTFLPGRCGTMLRLRFSTLWVLALGVCSPWLPTTSLITTSSGKVPADYAADIRVFYENVI